MPDYNIPFTAPRELLQIVAAEPVTWSAGAVTLLFIALLAVRGLATTIRSLAARIAAWRNKHPDTRTMTVAQVKATSDYGAATAAERAALDRLDRSTKLVQNAHFLGHTAAVARRIVGDELSKQWPYRHINLEEAAEDLRASYASLRLGPATYWRTTDDP